MNQIILSLTASLTRNEPTTLQAIKAVEQSLKVIFPKDYKEWMIASNGCSGFIGKNSFIQLWPIGEIIKLNEIGKTATYAPGLVFFGSDGGDEGFAFDYRSKPYSIIMVPFLDMESQNLKRVCGVSFQELLEYLAK